MRGVHCTNTKGPTFKHIQLTGLDQIHKLQYNDTNDRVIAKGYLKNAQPSQLCTRRYALDKID